MSFKYLKVAVLVLLVGIAAWKLNISALSSRFGSDTIWAALLVQPFIILSFFFAALRLGVFAGISSASVLLPLKAVILSYGMNLFLPARLSEFIKVGYLKDHAGIPFSSGLAALVLERLIDTLVMSVLIMTSVMFFYTNPNKMVTILAALALFGLLAIFFIKKNIMQFIAKIPWYGIRNFMERFVAHTLIHTRGVVVVKGLIYSVIFWVLSMISVVIFLNLISPIKVGIAGAIAVLTAATVGGVVQILPGGFGTYEAAVVFALSKYGYEYEDALYVALTLHASHVVFVLSCALVIAFAEGIGVRALLDRTMVLMNLNNHHSSK